MVRSARMIDPQRIGLPPGTRILAIDTIPGGWRLWLGTRDYIHGDFINLMHDGHVERVFVREDDGDQTHVIKRADK